MTGGVVKFNDKDITQWYNNWRASATSDENRRHFFVEKKHIEPFRVHYEESGKTSEYEQYGTVKFYNIVVDGKKLENGAWEFTSDNAGELKDYIGFRVSRRGDPANPHVDTFEVPEGDGVSVEEDWFG